MMSALCEIWGIMKNTLGMSYEEIASTWEGWNATGGLVRTSGKQFSVLYAELNRPIIS